MTQAAGRLTTHVLDTATGRPGAGLRVALSRMEADGTAIPLATATTNADGRCDRPLLEDGALLCGEYELVFHVAEWRGAAPGFFDRVPIRFRVTDPAAHHHVPLILSPFGYSTYRGS